MGKASNLFSKTWLNDFEWIELAIYSVLHHCTEPINWYITTETLHRNQLNEVVGRARSHFPDRKSDNFRLFDCELVWPECQNIHDGYMRQQWIKMNAHKIIGDHIIWNWDSDVLAINSFDSTNFLKDSKPIVWWDDMNMLIQGGYPHERKALLSSLFPNYSCREFMRCMPIPLHGECLMKASKSDVWKKSFDLCAQNNRVFTEFNTIGEYAYENCPDLFCFKNAHNEGPSWAGEANDKTKIVTQCWSWGKVNQGIRDLVLHG